jgi:hypothetical protein
MGSMKQVAAMLADADDVHRDELRNAVVPRLGEFERGGHLSLLGYLSLLLNHGWPGDTKTGSTTVRVCRVLIR